MKFLLPALCLSLALAPSLAQAQDVVTLSKGDKTIKVMIGNEVFTTYYYTGEYKKPFFLPVQAPGGFDLLAKADAASELGKKVIVATDMAKLMSDSGSSTPVKYGEVLEVAKVEGDKLWIADKSGWVSKSDVAPLASNVVRLIDPNQREHPHHKGIWLAIDEVNGQKFWFETDPIKPISAEIVTASGNPAKIKLVNHWMGKDGNPIVIEETEVSIFANRLISYDFTLKAAVDQVTFADTKEGMFGIRMPESMQENVGKGKVFNDQDVVGTGKLWGKAAAWIDYNGPVDGHPFGIMLMDHPDNPRKSKYHVRDYGLFSISPFGDRAYSNNREPAIPSVMKKGESYRYRYALWIHAGEATKAECQKVFDQFVAAEK